MSLYFVIQDKVWKDIKSSTGSFAEAVRKCIYKIAQRQFDTGLRVKKLKGVSRLVWEARIDGASRLLFTYRQTNDSNGQSQKVIAVEAVCRDHDDVSRQANLTDSNWWEGEEIQALGSLDYEFDLLNVEEQDEIKLWEATEIEIQAELTDDLLGNIKWLILEPAIIASEQEWQEARASGADLRLRLTSDESKVIDSYGNLLLSGSAGTGKTTVGLYRLARTMQMNPTGRYLYTAYNPILVKESQEQFKQLWGSSDESLPHRLDFLTIKDLCLKITQDCGENFDRILVGYPEFYERYIRKPESKQYSPPLIWDEIRSIVKGSNLKEQTDSYLLSLKEYEKLGGKRSGIIPQSERTKIYKLAEWYQKYLNSEKLADEIDLSRLALRCNKRYQYNPYSLIVCDEVQDFTEIQLELLIKLLAKNGQILCAGDINQMISPSGFRWEDLTTRLYHQDRQWTREVLPFNFRSTGKLVSLAQKLINLKFKLLGESQLTDNIPIHTNGEPARLVQVSQADINRIKLGAADAILVRTEKRKAELSTALGTKLIFTIEESKGLEFDVVYLLDFFEPSKTFWTAVLNPSKPLKNRQHPELRLEFNLLYVAITRARRLLNICEIEVAELWKRAEIFSDLIQRSSDDVFNQDRSIDPQDWYARAVYYLDGRLLPQAWECAMKSGDESLLQNIQIESFLAARRYDEAARLLLDLNRYLEAAEIFEQVSAWQQASEAWSLAGNFNRQVECLLKDNNKREAIRILIANEKYDEAVQIPEELDDWKEAAQIWKQSGNEDYYLERQVKYLLESGKKQQSMILLVSAEKYDKASEICGVKVTRFTHLKSEGSGEVIDESQSTGRLKVIVNFKNTYAIASYISEFLFDKDSEMSVERREALSYVVDCLISEFYGINSHKFNTIKQVSQELMSGKLKDLIFYQESLAKSLEQIKALQNISSNSKLELMISQNIERVLNSKSVILNKSVFNVLESDNLFLDRNNAPDYNNRGNLKNSLNDPQGVLSDYNRADLSDAKAYNDRGNWKKNLNDLEGALSDLNRAIALDPNLAKAYYNRGNLKYQKLNDPQGALSDLNRAIALDPNYTIAYYNRSNLKKNKLNDPQGALSDLNRAIALDPSDASAYCNRGNLKYQKLNDPQGALSDYNRAISIDPSYADAYGSRCNLRYQKLNNRTGAIADTKKAIELYRAQGNTQSLNIALKNLAIMHCSFHP